MLEEATLNRADLLRDAVSLWLICIRENTMRTGRRRAERTIPTGCRQSGRTWRKKLGSRVERLPAS